MTHDFCYCGSKKVYSACCGLLIETQQRALSPEALMRSRYSAYAQANIAYIEATMRGPAAEGFDALAAEAWAKRVTWLRLHVIKARYHQKDSARAMVEFKAYYLDHGVESCLHEKSKFVRIDGRWLYHS